MDTTFLNCLLVFSLLLILILYLYQTMPLNGAGKSNNKKEKFYPIIFDTCSNVRTSGMPVHRVGPVINFHQSFNKYNPALNAGMPTGIPGTAEQLKARYNVGSPTGIPGTAEQLKARYQLAMPTGIPEMGWRNFYLKNFNKYQVPNDDPFAGTPVRNLLNNMDNVDNIYRKCL